MDKDSKLYEQYENEVNDCWKKLAKAKTFEECRKILDSWPNWCEYETSLQDLDNKLENNDMEEESDHRKLHDRTVEAREKHRKAQTGITTSDFGKKYFEHYGYGETFNKKQYKREHRWYRRHGYCSLEK